MNFLNNLNDFFMSKDYSADQGGIYSKGADGASNADSGVDENGSGVFDSASSSPYFCSEHFEESPRDSTDEISNPSAFTPFVRKSLGGKVDASDSQAGQKRKKSESPGNGGGASNEEDVFRAIRSKVLKAGGLGGVGGISSNGAGAPNTDGESTSLSPFDTGQITPSQEESDQSEAALINLRKLENLDSFWNSLNPEGKKEVNKPISYDSSKIEAPVADMEPIQERKEVSSNDDDPDTVSNASRVSGLKISNHYKRGVDGGSSSNVNSNDGRDPNPLGGFGAFRSRSPNVGGLGGVGGSYSNGVVGGVDYRESDTSASKSNDGSEVNLSQQDDELFLMGVKNLEQLQRDSKKISQLQVPPHQQEAPSSPTASSSSSIPSSLTPSESPASTSGSPGLGGVTNNQPNNIMGG